MAPSHMITLDRITHDSITHDVITHDSITHDVVTHDLTITSRIHPGYTDCSGPSNYNGMHDSHRPHTTDVPCRSRLWVLNKYPL